MKPTYEDIVKYHSQATRLLVNIECYALPLEIRIVNVIEDGAIFQFNQAGSWMMGGQWVKTEQVEVLHVFPPKELIARIHELENPILTIKDVKQVLAKAEDTNVLTYALLEEVHKHLTDTKKKKCKKKKNCPTDSTK